MASRPAFQEALALARANKASLTILHVIAPFAPSLGEGYVPPRTWESIEIQVRSQAQRELAKLVARAHKAGVRARPPTASSARRAPSAPTSWPWEPTGGAGGLDW